jgi:surface antigen
MRLRIKGSKLLIFGSVLALGLPVSAASAEPVRDVSAQETGAAPSTDASRNSGDRIGREIQISSPGYHSFPQRLYARTAAARTSHPSGARLQCVPFARAASGIELKGNAVTWWGSAAGAYERGHRPEPGSVLNFRATGQMRLGHVAVVTRVVNPREVEIDHANWASYGGKGNVSRGITVVDVSTRNDWSAVRVELGHTGEFGSIYPTYGFIYDRPDHGMILANDLAGAGRNVPEIRIAGSFDEVAEAPLRVRNIPSTISFADAPDRSIR